MTAPHPHRGGHCDCDDHDGHRRSCEDPDCRGCLADGAHDPGCEWCEGDGLLPWAWDEEDRDECSVCHADDVPVCGWGEDGEEPVCLPCARRLHAESCGCDAPGWSLDEARP